MRQDDLLAERFEANRIHLRGVAYRMLGSASDADDAVQQAWLRLDRADVDGVENLSGWLTTVVARICLDMLRSRTAKREDSLDAQVQPSSDRDDAAIDPEYEALLADSVGLALLVVLETLTPAERLSFVLHDMFAVPFDEIAPIVGRTPDAARQLASRARRRVQGPPAVQDVDRARQREVVEAFLAASRGGDFDSLLTLLDPDVVLHVDRSALPANAPREVHGAAAVAGQARTYASRARFADLALVDGSPAIVVAPAGHLQIVLAFAVRDGKIVDMDLIADPERLDQLELSVLSD